MTEAELQQTADAVAGTVIGVATVLGEPEISMIVGLLDRYGPALAFGVINLFKKAKAGGATIEDVEAAFAPLKKYAEYQIPDAVPQTPATAPTS